jgi:hypothetical protein
MDWETKPFLKMFTPWGDDEFYWKHPFEKDVILVRHYSESQVEISTSVIKKSHNVWCYAHVLDRTEHRHHDIFEMKQQEKIDQILMELIFE